LGFTENESVRKWAWEFVLHMTELAAIEMRHILIFISLMTISCRQNLQDKETNKNTDTINITDTLIKGKDFVGTSKSEPIKDFQYQTVPFEIEKYYPKVSDTTSFLKALVENCHLYSNERSSKRLENLKKFKLNGSTKYFYYIEYSYPISSNAEFPGRYQIILDDKGNLLKIISAVRIDVVKILPFEKYYLFALLSTAHGNGGHEVYKITKDTLEQVLDGFLGYRPQTYSTGYDNEVNIPYELHHKFLDENNDGFNDIVFFGKVRYSKIDLGTQDKTSPVKFIFLYNKTNGHFIEKEDYSEKYKFIYGDTK